MSAAILHMPASKRRSDAQRSSRQTVGIVVQARMTSTRFPGKSMSLLAGKPVLQHVLERCKLIKISKKYDSKVILAAPDNDSSNPMIELANKLNVENSCSDEHNVLKRYYDTARHFHLGYIIRITADCPFIDPKVCEEVFNLLVWRKCDYASNIYPKRTYPKGLDCECFTFECLEATYSIVTESKESFFKDNVVSLPDINHKYDMEHVTPFMQRTPGIKKALVSQLKNQSQKNWCVDVPEDIPRLEKLIAKQELKLVVSNDKTT